MFSMLLTFIVVLTIAFTIIIIVLKNVLMKDTDSAVNRLQSSYTEAEKKKAELTKRLMEIEEEYKKKKQEADIVAKQIIEKAQNEAYQIRQDAFKKAKVESEDIITKAQRTVDKIREDIKKELETNLIDYCGRIFSSIFKTFAQQEIERVLIDEFLEEVKGADLSKIDSSYTSVELLYPKSIGQENRANIQAILNDRLKRKITITEKSDSSLLAGIVLKFGSLTLDGSLAARIKDTILAEKTKIDERV